MRDLFNMDNGFFRTLGRLADLMILNVIFIICCIPIVTIGASFTGLYYVTLKMAENEEGYIIKGFLKSFRENFKQATLIWLMVLALGIVFLLDLQIIRFSEGTFFTVIRIGILAIGAIYLMVVSYVFPILSRFYNSIRATIKNAFLMAVANLPYTLLILVINIAPIVITLINGYTLWYGLLVWLLCGFSGVAFMNSWFLRKIFARYVPKDTEEETNPDDWQVEEHAEELAAEDASDSEIIEEAVADTDSN